MLVTGGNGLLGGPPLGLIFGDTEAIKRVETSAAWRWLRADLISQVNMVLALRAWTDQPAPDGSITSMLQTQHANLVDRAGRLRNRLEQAGFEVSLRSEDVFAKLWDDGVWTVPTVQIDIRHPTESNQVLSRRLATNRPLVLPASDHDVITLDLRWVAAGLDPILAQQIIGENADAAEPPRDEQSSDSPNDLPPDDAASHD